VAKIGERRDRDPHAPQPFRILDIDDVTHVKPKQARLVPDRSLFVLALARELIRATHDSPRDWEFTGEVSTARLRAAHSPASVVALVRERDQLFLSWSAAKECAVGAQDCWTYSVPWPQPAD
jgi:hypothetical protein